MFVSWVRVFMDRRGGNQSADERFVVVNVNDDGVVPGLGRGADPKREHREERVAERDQKTP